MHRDLEREARKQSATLEEIIDPAYTVALPSSYHIGTTEQPQVPDRTVNDVEIPVEIPVETPIETPIEHTLNKPTSTGNTETESEQGDSDNELLSPKSTDSGMSMTSIQMLYWYETIAHMAGESGPPGSPRSIDSRTSTSSSQSLYWREIAYLRGESESSGSPRSIDSGTSTSSSQISDWDDIVASVLGEIEPVSPLSGAAAFGKVIDKEGGREEESTDPLEAASAAPTSTHLAAVATLSPDEKIHLINEFLQQNADRLDAFRTRESVENPVWQDRRELGFFTDAVLWLDALLSSFRKGIINEDVTVLRPRLDDASRDLELAMRAQTEKRGGKEKEGMEMPVPRELYDRIIEIQHSNAARNQLLGRTIFDTELFGNLLSAAESVRFRIESDGGTSSWAKMVEGMRRIYSTIVCTVPFGWAEVGEYSFTRVPVQEGMLSFDLSLLPTPAGTTTPVLTGPEGTIHSSSQGNEVPNPLSKEYWRNIAKGALPNVGPPQQSQVGEASSEDNTRSPNPSDSSSISDITDKLFPPVPVVPVRTSKGPFCLLVNTPAGCQDRENCGYNSHVNEGKVCKGGDNCRHGSRCAFVHESPTAPDPASRRSSTTQVDATTRDLRPILGQVLQNVEQYKVCGFVNKDRGCKAEKEGRECRFNHTLRDIVCPEYKQNQNCPRDFRCPLMHVNEYVSTVVQPDQTIPQTEQMPAQMPAPQPAAPTANGSSVPKYVFSNQHRHQPVAQREDTHTQLSRFFGKSTENVRRPDKHTAQQGGPAETIFTPPPAAPRRPSAMARSNSAR